VVAYATRRQLYQLALPKGVASEPAREVTAVDTSADWLESDGHGLATDTPVEFVAFNDAAVLPTPLAASTIYYAVEVAGSDSRFQVALTAGGAAIDLTGAGSGTFGVRTPLNEEIDAELEYQSRRIDDRLPAHIVPLTSPYPEVVVVAVCRLTARSMLRRRGLTVQTIEDEATVAFADVMTWAKGVPLRDSRATGSANLAQVWGEAPRGWALDDGRVL